jgi:hypothetical protein
MLFDRGGGSVNANRMLQYSGHPAVRLLQQRNVDRVIGDALAGDPDLADALVDLFGGARDHPEQRRHNQNYHQSERKRNAPDSVGGGISNKDW